MGVIASFAEAMFHILCAGSLAKTHSSHTYKQGLALSGITALIGGGVHVGLVSFGRQRRARFRRKLCATGGRYRPFLVCNPYYTPTILKPQPPFLIYHLSSTHAHSPRQVSKIPGKTLSKSENYPHYTDNSKIPANFSNIAQAFTLEPSKATNYPIFTQNFRILQ